MSDRSNQTQANPISSDQDQSNQDNQPQQDKLSLSALIAYGIGDFGPSAANNVLMVFFFFFLTTFAALPPNLAGIILLLSNGWSAISTLIVGVLSDRTRSPWGRRRIWMLFTAPVMGISFFLQWWILPLDTWVRFSYYLVVAILFQTAGNAYTIPYGALITDLTEDNHEHIRLNGFRFGFSLSGCIGALLLAQMLDRWVSQPQQQLWELGMLGGLMAIGSISCCCWGTVEQRATPVTSSGGSINELKDLLRNRPMLLLVGIYAFSWTAMQITPAILPYFVVDYMGLEPSAIAQVVLVMQGSALAALLLWEPLSRQVGKKLVYWVGISIWVLANIGLLNLQVGQVGLMYGYAVVVGSGMATAYLVPPSMLPEVVDFDELETGHRREGLVYSILIFLQKATLALGLFLVGQILSWSGFQEALPGPIQLLQTDSALTAIRWITVFLPALALVISLVLVYFYPINRAVHQDTLSQLQQRRVTASE